MTNEEFMLTLPSNASMSCYPQNHPNSFKVLLPKTLELEGEWEASIISIQYPFNWPNFPDEFIAISGDVNAIKNPADREYFLSQCKQSYFRFNNYEIAKKLEATCDEYFKSVNGRSVYLPWENVPNVHTGSRTKLVGKLVKIPSGHYANPGELANYLCETFNKPDPIVDKDSKNPFKIKSTYDPITKNVDFESENFLWVNTLSLSKDFHLAIGREPNLLIAGTLCVSGSHKDFTQKPTLETLKSMYIYCDAIKYQIVGDTQAPLLASLAIQGKPGDQCFWAFNPHYYIPVSQKTISTIELRICTENGDKFPFHPSGRVVIQLHFRRQRGPW